jgi:hypothetical protein
MPEELLNEIEEVMLYVAYSMRKTVRRCFPQGLSAGLPQHYGKLLVSSSFLLLFYGSVLDLKDT